MQAWEACTGSLARLCARASEAQRPGKRLGCAGLGMSNRVESAWILVESAWILVESAWILVESAVMWADSDPRVPGI